VADASGRWVSDILGELGATKALGSLVQSGSVKLVELDEAALHWIIAFLERYASVGAQMADAAVMYIAEREGIAAVFTLDRRDFSAYRTTDGRALEILPENLRLPYSELELPRLGGRAKPPRDRRNPGTGALLGLSSWRERAIRLLSTLAGPKIPNADTYGVPGIGTQREQRRHAARSISCVASG
jgi:hypothetical protein